MDTVWEVEISPVLANPGTSSKFRLLFRKEQSARDFVARQFVADETEVNLMRISDDTTMRFKESLIPNQGLRLVTVRERYIRD